MAFTNFYVQTTGSDKNAGSTTDNAAVYTTLAGNWSTATNKFTPTDGSTPANSVAVNDYVSIMATGATVTIFTAKVTAVAAGVNGDITVSSTLKWGTAPSTNSGSRELRAGGAFATEQPPSTQGWGGTTIGESTKINIKAATYTFGGVRTFSMAGTATLTLWYSGYQTTPGDLDATRTNTLTRVTFALGASNTMTMSGALQTWSGIIVTGSRNGVLIATSATQFYASRCQWINTGTGTLASLNATSANGKYAYCYFSVPTTATAADMMPGGASNLVYVGCVFEGGGRVQVATTTFSVMFLECCFINGTGALTSTTGSLRCYDCTFSVFTGNAIAWSGTPGGGSIVGACLFRSITGTAIFNNSGTNTRLVELVCNDFYNNGTNETGFGDTPDFFVQTDSSDPVVSASDLTPIPSSNAWAAGFPGLYENETFGRYVHIGGATPVPGGSSGGIFGG